MSIPISVELYSVKNELKKDLYATLAKVKEFGYEAVEFAGAPAHSANEYLDALNKAGLWCSSWHVPYTTLLDVSDEELDKVIEFHKTVGNKYLIIPGVDKEMLESYDAIKATADKMNTLSEKLLKHGLYTGYHNHWSEFTIVEETGKTKWSTLRELTNENFVMQLDLGNAIIGGADINAEIMDAPTRSQLIHLKPGSKTHKEETMIGADTDDVDYETILTFCKEKANTEVFVIEYECIKLYSEFDGVKQCIDNLKSKFGHLI